MFKNFFTTWLQPGYKVNFVNDLPDDIKNRTIYIVGVKKNPWLIAFYCPCGCRELIQLNLLKESSPCWSFKINRKGKIDISPSIQRIVNCKSHFYIRKSRIVWAKSATSQKF